MNKAVYINNLRTLKATIDDYIDPQNYSTTEEWTQYLLMPFGLTINDIEQFSRGDRSLTRVIRILASSTWESFTFSYNPVGWYTLAAQVFHQLSRIKYDKVWKDLKDVLNLYQLKVLHATKTDIAMARNAVDIKVLSEYYGKLKKLNANLPTGKYDTKSQEMAREAMADIAKSWYIMGLFLIISSILLLALFGYFGGHKNIEIIQHFKERDTKGLLQDFAKLGAIALLAAPAIIGICFIIVALTGFKKDSYIVKIIDKLNLNINFIQNFRDQLDSLLGLTVSKIA